MRQEDEQEFADFVRAHQASLFRTAFLLTGDYQLAEDILQATFMKVYLRWGHIRSMEWPTAYARRILVNQTTSWWRKRSARETTLLELRDTAVPGHADVVVDHDATWRAVCRLSPKQRAVIVLRYYEDLTEVETAAVLDVAVGTVKSRCHAACQRLAGLLAEPVEATGSTESTREGRA